MLDIERLFQLVEAALPLGRDEWERLAVTYNVGRARGSPERDFESLRRKFKVLYSARKPTGMPEMPPHIKRAKEIKRAIDEKANVIEIDDEADRDQRFVEPDFSFEPDADTDFLDGEREGSQHALDSGTSTGDAIFPGESVSGESTGSSGPPTCGEFQDLLATPLVDGELAARAHTPWPASLRPPQTPCPDGPATDGGRPAGCQQKRSKYKTSSNRLGGVDLTAFRDTVGSKRSFEEDKDTLEASFAKAKRIRAMKATTALKAKLSGLESTANHMGGSIMETILVLREENERKAEARRADEEQRRRDDKAEAEERRRQEKMEAREEARARTQELILLISALTKKD